MTCRITMSRMLGLRPACAMAAVPTQYRLAVYRSHDEIYKDMISNVFVVASTHDMFCANVCSTAWAGFTDL